MKYFHRIIKHYILLLLGKVYDDVHTELDGAFDALKRWVLEGIVLAIREHEEIYHDG